MRTDESGEPLAHRVKTEADIIREARTGIDALLKQVDKARNVRERAANDVNLELDAIMRRRLQAAQVIADRFEWKPVASVALTEQQLCSHCGACHTLFRGFHTLFQRKADECERMVMADCLDRSLPFQLRELLSKAPCCADCMKSFIGEVNQVSHPHRFIPCGRLTKE